MVGKTHLFIAHVKAIAQNAQVAIIIHHQALPVKDIPNPMKTVLDDVMKIFYKLKITKFKNSQCVL
jgi:hypothetical protein